MNKKGSIMDLFLLIIIAFITIVLFAVFIFGMGIITDKITTVPQTDFSLVNISEAGQATFGNLNDAIQFLTVIAFTIIIGLSLSILVSNIFIRSHPFFYVLYVIIVIIAIVFSAIVSNAYEELLTGTELSATFQLFTGANFIMANLPVWITVIGIFGAIFLFINIPRDEGALGGFT